MTKFKLVLREVRTTTAEKRVEIEAPSAGEALRLAGEQVETFASGIDVDVDTTRDFTVLEDLGDDTNYDKPLLDSFNGPQDEAVAEYLARTQ